MPVKVTVVVPVYNAGDAIEPCIASLLEQTLPPEELELVFVDDGSTDDTPARLRRLADEHPHVRVHRIPNSGWPGRPRNVGIDMASGEYVQFVDQDDMMAPDALRRMYELGRRNDSDIVIGKVTSNFRGVPHGVFRRNVDRCTIHDFNLIDSLTPHKMFRRAFLNEEGIRYAEGKRRLEDQLFMVQSYFPAKVVSILGDYPCYFYMRRQDGKNTGSARIDPVGYYNNLREVLDVVDKHTVEGEFRSKLLRRFYRVEMLGRLGEPSMPKYPDDYRQELWGEVRKLAGERFPEDVPDGLTGVTKLRARLLRDNRLDDAVEFARRCDQLEGRVHATAMDWVKGKLRIRMRAFLALKGGRPLVVVAQGDRRVLDPQLTNGIFDPSSPELDAGDGTAGARVEVVIRNRETAVEWFVPAKMPARVLEAEPLDGAQAWTVECTGEATIDPLTLAGGNGPLPRGTWDIWVRVSAAGITRKTRLGALRDPGVGEALEPAVHDTLVAVPFLTEFGNLSFDIDRHKRSLTSATSAPVRVSVGSGGQLSVVLPIQPLSGLRGAAAWAVLDSGDGTAACWLPALLKPKGAGVVLQAATAGVAAPVVDIPPGPYHAAIRLDPGFGGVVSAGELLVPVLPLRGRATPAPSATAQAVTRAVGYQRVRRGVRRVVRRLPEPAAALARRGARKLRSLTS